MNTEFLGRSPDRAHARRHEVRCRSDDRGSPEALLKIGGFDRLKDYLAEDFVMGKFAAEAGIDVILSSYVIEHRIGTQDFVTTRRTVCAGAAAPGARGRPAMSGSSLRIRYRLRCC